MTERDRHAVERSATSFAVGPSSLEWRDGVLEIRLDEIAVPVPRRVRGTIRVHPLGCPDLSAPLDADGRHHWQPIAPRSRVELALEHPGLSWSGHGYLDSNRGRVPLEADFTSWHWSRAQAETGPTTVFYDVKRRDGGSLGLALQFDESGRVTPIEAPPLQPLPTSRWWRIGREARVRDGALRDLRTLEDTPFYARSLFSDGIALPAHVVHESLSLERFDSAWVQALLPFRMPRLTTRGR